MACNHPGTHLSRDANVQGGNYLVRNVSGRIFRGRNCPVPSCPFTDVPCGLQCAVTTVHTGVNQGKLHSSGSVILSMPYTMNLDHKILNLPFFTLIEMSFLSHRSSNLVKRTVHKYNFGLLSLFKLPEFFFIFYV